MPGEEFRKVFTITPDVKSSTLILGSACVRWRRKPETEDDQSTSTAAESCILTKSKLPEVNVGLPPFICGETGMASLRGDPFAYIINIKNQSKLLQEVNFSLADAQNFVLSGSHNDTVFTLLSLEHVVSYKIVPLCSGMQQLPRVNVTSVRYSAAFQPSVAASTVFIFPSKPDFFPKVGFSIKLILKIGQSTSQFPI
ncbi:hypothetical protein LINPERPRIM_LOCUS40788 [Linum perenne]